MELTSKPYLPYRVNLIDQMYESRDPRSFRIPLARACPSDSNRDKTQPGSTRAIREPARTPREKRTITGVCGVLAWIYDQMVTRPVTSDE
jgi:hypothetical protein